MSCTRPTPHIRTPSFTKQRAVWGQVFPMVDGIVERARARVRAAELELERAKVDLARLEVERAAVPAFHVSQESQWGAGLPPPLLEVVVSHVLGWEDRAMSAAFRAVCTTWNAAHDALCSRLAPLLWDGCRKVTHEAKWLTRFPQVSFPSLIPYNRVPSLHAHPPELPRSPPAR